MATCKKRKAQSGQAVIEYILILSVVILLILGGVYQFNDSFRNYVRGFFGGYIACLLETGELPSLGASQVATQTCVAQYRAFDPNSGQPLLTGGAGSGGGGAGSGGGGAANTSRGRPGQGGRTTSGGSAPTANADSVGSSGGPQTAASLFNSSGRPRRQTVGQVGNSSTVSEKGSGESEFSSAPTQTVGQVRTNRDRVSRMTIDRRGFFDQEEREETGRANITTPIAAQDRQNLKPKRLQFEAKRAPTATMKESSTDFSVGGLLRLFLIVAIILALLFFLGGQALQISKSWEK